MMRTIQLAVALVGVLVVTAGQLQAGIIVIAGGTSAPSATLGPFTMTPFPDDTRSVFSNVTNIPSPLGGQITTSSSVNHREIGNGWASWSHGYTGDVYYSNGLQSVTLSLPASTGAFYFYVEPQPFSFHDITATTDSGAMVTQNVTGSSGAAYYGFYTDASDTIASITISSPTTDFAFGEFGIAQTAAVPEPSSLAVFGIGACVAAGGAARRRRREKSQEAVA